MPEQYNQNQVTFEGERSVLYTRLEPSTKTPALVQWIVRIGLAKNEKQASVFLLGFVVVVIIVTVIIIMTTGESNVPLTTPGPT